MNHQLTPTQAFWLGHLYHAHSLGLSLSAYAKDQELDFADLMTWRRRLEVQYLVLPPVHRPNRFVMVEVRS